MSKMISKNKNCVKFLVRNYYFFIINSKKNIFFGFIREFEMCSNSSKKKTQYEKSLVLAHRKMDKHWTP